MAPLRSPHATWRAACCRGSQTAPLRAAPSRRCACSWSLAAPLSPSVRPAPLHPNSDTAPELQPEAGAEAEAETARKPVASETPALTPSLPLSRRAPPSGPTAAREGQGKGQRGRQGKAQRAQLARGGG